MCWTINGIIILIHTENSPPHNKLFFRIRHKRSQAMNDSLHLSRPFSVIMQQNSDSSTKWLPTRGHYCHLIAFPSPRRPRRGRHGAGNQARENEIKNDTPLCWRHPDSRKLLSPQNCVTVTLYSQIKVLLEHRKIITPLRTRIKAPRI